MHGILFSQDISMDRDLSFHSLKQMSSPHYYIKLEVEVIVGTK